MAIKTSCSKSMGQLLLSGWAMLAETCVDCQVPLMKNPKTGDMLCVNCDRTYPVGTDFDSVGPADDADAQTHGDATPQHHPNGSHDGGPAAGAPPPSASHALLTQQPPRSSTPSHSDKASSLLSDKMLQGWALLETSCPRCGTPLVRNKQKQMRCVMCDAWVVNEADAPSATHARPTSAALTTTGAAATAAPEAEAAGAAAREVESAATPHSTPVPPARGVPDSGLAMRQPPPPGMSPATSALAPIPPQRDQQCEAAAAAVPLELLSALSSTLQNKLWETQRLLASTPADEPLAIKSYAAMVSESLDALAKLRHEMRAQLAHGGHA